MTALMPQVTADQARTLTDRIKVAVEGTWHLITEAYNSRAYTALGYTSWDDYCTREFGASRLPIPREERPERVASLRDAGLSIRAIESVTGHHRETIIKDLRQVVGNRTPEPDPIVVEELTEIEDSWPDDEPALTEEECEALDGAALSQPYIRSEPIVPPERITGTDGKSYPKPTPAAPKRAPITDQFWKAAYDLGKGVNRVTNLAQDDRFHKNADRIKEMNLSDLIRARDALQCVIDQLTA